MSALPRRFALNCGMLNDVHNSQRHCIGKRRAPVCSYCPRCPINSSESLSSEMPLFRAHVNTRATIHANPGFSRSSQIPSQTSFSSFMQFTSAILCVPERTENRGTPPRTAGASGGARNKTVFKDKPLVLSVVFLEQNEMFMTTKVTNLSKCSLGQKNAHLQKPHLSTYENVPGPRGIPGVTGSCLYPTNPQVEKRLATPASVLRQENRTVG